MQVDLAHVIMPNMMGISISCFWVPFLNPHTVYRTTLNSGRSLWHIVHLAPGHMHCIATNLSFMECTPLDRASHPDVEKYFRTLVISTKFSSDNFEGILVHGKRSFVSAVSPFKILSICVWGFRIHPSIFLSFSDPDNLIKGKTLDDLDFLGANLSQLSLILLADHVLAFLVAIWYLLMDPFLLLQLD